MSLQAYSAAILSTKVPYQDLSQPDLALTGDSFLKKTDDNRFEVIPKNPAFVLGEKIASATSSFFYSLDKTLSKIPQIFPTAQAIEIKHPSKIDNFEKIHSMGFDSFNPIGTVLDELFGWVTQQMEQIVADTASAESKIIMEAGEAICIAIQDAKNAYIDCLKLTINQVQEAIQVDLNHIDTMVQLFEQRNIDLLKDLPNKIQQFINSLPFSKLQPSLLKSSPKFVVGDFSNITLAFEGNFPFSADPEFVPSLSFNNRTLELTDSTTYNLMFEGSFDSIFLKKGNQSIHTYSASVGTLQIPWDNTDNLPWYWRDLGYTSTKVYEYKVLVKALPLSPGKITAVYSTSHASDPIVKRFVSETIHEDANHAWYKNRPHGMSDIHSFSFKPDPDFSVVQGTPVVCLHDLRPEHDEPHGNHQEKFTSIRPDGVNLEIGEDACSGKHMGIVTFHVEFDEIKPTTVEDISQDTVDDFKWGDSVLVPLNKDKEGRLVNLIYQAFDGSKTIFGISTDLTNRYVKVINQGDNLMLKATPPGDFMKMKIKMLSKSGVFCHQ